MQNVVIISKATEINDQSIICNAGPDAIAWSGERHFSCAYEIVFVFEILHARYIIRKY